MGVELRDMGTTALLAPQIKRGTARLSTGQSVLVVPDTNRTGSNGDDVTGTAKIFIYLSTTAARTAYTLALSYTSGTPFASSTKAAVLSCTTREDNTLYVAYQGTDNSLRIISFAWSGTTYTGGTEETIVAGNAVTNRYRSIDVDSAATNSNRAVAVYEADASSGQGARARVYVRNNSAAWVQAWEHQFLTTQFIRAGSEDVCLAFSLAGVVSNVVQIAVYYTQTYTTGDNGDFLREISYNVSTGTTNSATAVGTWYSTLSKNIAAGARRGWLFAEASSQWVFGTSVGTAVPFFMGMRIEHNIFTGLTQNKTSVAIEQFRDSYFALRRDNNVYTAVTAEYSDYALVFAFSGLGIITNYMARSVMIKFSSTLAAKSALAVDAVARPLDNGYNLLDGVIGVYGGGNKNLTSGLTSYNFAIMYGASGDSVSATTGVLSRKIFAAIEDTISTPVILSPSSVIVPIARPTIRVSGQHINLYSNVLAKLQIQIATDTGFTASLQTITQPDSDYISYSATSGAVPPIRSLSYTLTQAQSLTGEVWYMRARLLDDLGGNSGWSATATFTVLHPPSAMPVSPANGVTQVYNSGNVNFTWVFSDTEPTDVQSAYQLIIVRLDTGATVFDSGKTVSSLKTVVQNISSTLKDIPLQWRVALWDSNDDQGAFSNATIFTLADPPVVTITTPVPGSITLNANPTFEVDASDWTLITATSFVRSTAQFQSGVASGLLTPNGVATSAEIATTAFMTVTPLHIYRAAAWLRVPSIWAAGANLAIDWYTSGNVFISTDLVATGSIPATTWVQYVNHAEAPSNAAKAKLRIALLGTPAAGNTLFVDEVRFGRAVSSSAIPTVGWNFTVGGTRTQRAFRVRVWDTVESPELEVGDSGWVYSNATTYTFPVQILNQFGSYRADVYVQDTVGLQDSDFLIFTTDWVEPALGNVSLIFDTFKVTASWTNAPIDTDWVAWRLYRRYQKTALAALDVDNTATTWVLLYETTDVASSYSYRDYLAPLNKSVDYVVVQLVDRFGSLIESDISSFQTVNQLGDRYYFVPEVPIGLVASFEAANVTGDAFVREVEQETLHVIGRGRQVQIGDDLGYAGTLTIKLRNPSSARSDREFFEHLSSDDTGNVYIKSPFGDVLFVALGNISVNRVPGSGSADIVDLSVPYSEVFTAVTITRAGV